MENTLKESPPAEEGAPQDLMDRVISQLRERGLTDDAIGELARKTIQTTVRNKAQEVVEMPLEGAVSTYIKASREALEKATRLALEEIGEENIPLLDYEDLDRDRYIKIKFFKILLGTPNDSRPLVELMRSVVEVSFDNKIAYEDVIAFFQNDKVLELMVKDGVLENLGIEVYRELHHKEVNIKKLGSLSKRFKEFHAKYNPHDVDHSFTTFFNKALVEYGKETIEEWCRMNMRRLTDILKQDGNSNTRIDTIIKRAYYEMGKDNPKIYIRQRLPRFVRRENGRFTIEVEDVRDFYNEELPKLITKKNKKEPLVKMVFVELREYLHGLGATEETIFILEKTGRREGIEGVVDHLMGITLDNDNSLDPLANAGRTPRIFKELLNNWSGLGGEEKYRSYISFHFNDGITENIDKSEKIFQRYMKNAKEFLDQVANGAGLNTEQREVFLGNTRELTRKTLKEVMEVIVNGSDPKIRFTARRLFVLAAKFKYAETPRIVFRDVDAIGLEDRLRSLLDTEITSEAYNAVLDKHGNIVIKQVEPNYEDREPTIDDLKAIENEKDEKDIYETEDKESEEQLQGLLKGTLLGIDGYFYINAEEEGVVSRKGIQSAVAKNILKGTSFSEMPDLARLTFILKDKSELGDLITRAEKQFFIPDGLLKFKSNHQNADKDDFRMIKNGYKPSTGSSDEYGKNLLQAVIMIRVKDENNEKYYEIPIEIRVGINDLFRERIEGDEISHKMMEEERCKALVEIIAPEDVFPEVYS